MPCADIGAIFVRGGGVSLPETAMTPRQRRQAALAASVAKSQAEWAAKNPPPSPEQMAQFEEGWQRRTERAMRAKEARREKRRAKRPRDENPAPVATKLWAKAMSLQAATDIRLTMGARVALQAIRSLTARAKRVSRNGLAVLLGVSSRTAQRYLAELRLRGYIRTRLIANRLGWVIAQLIEVTEKVLPLHHREKIAPTMADGLARCIENGGRQGETALSPSKTKAQTIPSEMAGFTTLRIASGGP